MSAGIVRKLAPAIRCGARTLLECAATLHEGKHRGASLARIDGREEEWIMLGRPKNQARTAAGRAGTSARRSAPAKRGGATVDSKIKPPDHASMLARHASSESKIKPPD
jgi:hypothetical protein